MAILVTGGAGFIGANFVRYWLKDCNETIINLDKLTYAGNLENLATLASDRRHIFVQGDIGNQTLVTKLLNQHHPRAIINFAAESHVDRSIAKPDSFIQTNVVGTYHLLEAARHYWTSLENTASANFRFVHISTDEVYGSLAKLAPAFTEAHRFQPNSPYSASKAAADHLVRAYHHTYDLPVLTTNCSNNYGPLQFPEKLIPLTILNALSAKPLPVYGDGQNIRDWLFVLDHCEAIKRVLADGRVGETYNIGGLTEKANIAVVTQICEILDECHPKTDGTSYADQIQMVEDRPGHDKRYAIDTSKITNELGWKPTTSFQSGIRQTIQWYLQAQSWVEHIYNGSYQNTHEGMPL